MVMRVCSTSSSMCTEWLQTHCVVAIDIINTDKIWFCHFIGSRQYSQIKSCVIEVTYGERQRERLAKKRMKKC